ncbi:MAG: 50S ribosomal protein L6 [bacterium]|nr:50S ribosomal protein L6 [bacterium]
MSKIGKQPISIPENVQIARTEENTIKVKGPNGELSVPILEGVDVRIENGEISFAIKENKKQWRSNWGTLRALTQNAVAGVTKGFEKTLILEGVGYKAIAEGEGLSLALGFSHPVKVKALEGIKFEVEKNGVLKIKGIDKELVGQTAAKIRALKKPEPYKGKGFHYKGEIIRRKAGKKAASSAG